MKNKITLILLFLAIILAIASIISSINSLKLLYSIQSLDIQIFTATSDAIFLHWMKIWFFFGLLAVLITFSVTAFKMMRIKEKISSILMEYLNDKVSKESIGSIRPTEQGKTTERPIHASKKLTPEPKVVNIVEELRGLSETFPKRVDYITERGYHNAVHSFITDLPWYLSDKADVLEALTTMPKVEDYNGDVLKWSHAYNAARAELHPEVQKWMAEVVIGEKAVK